MIRASFGAQYTKTISVAPLTSPMCVVEMVAAASGVSDGRAGMLPYDKALSLPLSRYMRPYLALRAAKRHVLHPGSIEKANNDANTVT